MTKGYCMKCKKSVEMKDEKEKRTKKGMIMIIGKCPYCETTVCRMTGKK